MRVPKKKLSLYLQRTGTRLAPPPGRPGGLVGEYQAATDKANKANESRYNAILKNYDDLAARTKADLAGAGASTLADINRTYANTSSDMYQRLVNRGLANSSLPATMQMGIDRSRAQSVAGLNESLANSRINADMSITQGKSGVMERRTDVGPDPSQIMELYRRLGASGFGPGSPAAMYGQPIGMMPGMVANMYNTGLANHMNMMNGPAMMAPAPVANPEQDNVNDRRQMAKEARNRRAEINRRRQHEYLKFLKRMAEKRRNGF
jgi:hypothetical protein